MLFHQADFLRMRSISGRRRLTRLTSLPTVTADTTVPNPTPLSFPKKRRESTVEITISVTSK